MPVIHNCWQMRGQPPSVTHLPCVKHLPFDMCPDGTHDEHPSLHCLYMYIHILIHILMYMHIHFYMSACVCVWVCGLLHLYWPQSMCVAISACVWFHPTPCQRPQLQLLTPEAGTGSAASTPQSLSSSLKARSSRVVPGPRKVSSAPPASLPVSSLSATYPAQNPGRNDTSHKTNQFWFCVASSYQIAEFSHTAHLDNAFFGILF